MNSKRFLLIALSIGALSSCKKKDHAESVSYYPMSPGNYWVYEHFRLDSNYQSTGSLQTFDSVYIEKDTLISGRTFHKYMEPDVTANGAYSASFLRDSSGYLVDNSGNIRFTTRDFNTTFYSAYFIDTDHRYSLNDTAFLIQKKMGDRDKTVVVPAGTFTTSSWQSIYTMNEFFARFTTRTRILNSRYAAGVGMVSETMPFYVTESWYVERRLIRYSIQ